MKEFFILLFFQTVSGSCNYTHCIDTRKPQWDGKLSCGTVISDDRMNGVKCAHLTTARARYQDTQSFCKSLESESQFPGVKSGNLITLNTAAENDKTRDHARKINENTAGTGYLYAYAFIGIRKTCPDCNFFWEDLEPITYTNWYGSEPNTYYYDCAHLRFDDTYNGQWIDMTCTGTYHGICQFFPTGQPKIEPVTLPPKGGCKEGWWKFAGYCYKAFGYKVNAGDSSLNQDYFKQYLLANTTCNEEWTNATLALMPTREHNGMLAALMGPFFFGSQLWVGIYNWAYYDYYFSLDNKDKLTYDHWAPGKPNHMTGNVDKCTVMNWRSESSYHGSYSVGSWENVACTRNFPWMCSHEEDPSMASNYKYPEFYTLPDVKCDDGWIPYHSACYKLNLEKKSYDDANAFCQDSGPKGAYTSLLTLWDEYELEFGRTFLRDDQVASRDPMSLSGGYWMGLEYGSSRGSEFEKWKWIDNWPVTRSNWVGEHPNLDIGRCAFMSNKGHFETSECSTERSFVCKAEFYDFQPASQSEIDAAVGLPLPCEEGWELVGHHCDKVFPEPMSYGLAQQNCAFHKGYLGSIHSENQNGFVKDMFTKLNSESRGFWIGLQYKGNLDGWQWEDKSELSYTNWDAGEPNDWNGQQEDCTEVLKTGDWNDDPCTSELPYFCKKIAETEYCAAARTTTLKPLGFVGVTEEECRHEWKGCYDSFTQVAPGINCFKAKTPIDVGMAAGTAVGVTIGVLLACAGGYFALQKYGNPFAAVPTSISNPLN